MLYLKRITGLKTKFSNPGNVRSASRSQAGLTLVEVTIALAITAVTIGGIVTGYNYSLTTSVKDSLYMAANARAMERLEQVRGAIWNVAAFPQQDFLTTNNFPDEVVVLDQFATTSNVITATLKTQIAPISDNPPIRRIHVDCIWQFQGVQWITNSIESDRAPY